MTINHLIENSVINGEKFDKFLGSLQLIESSFSRKVKLCIVSGTKKDSACARHRILQDAFVKANRSDILQGFAYEYGGYFIDSNGKHYCINNNYLSEEVKNDLVQLAKKYNLNADLKYNLYLSFDGKMIDSTTLYNFFQECKKLNGVSIVYYDDQEGRGCDIKDPKLNKGAFVKFFLQNKNPSMVIVGGDDKEDLSMIIDYPNISTYFVGFASSSYSDESSSIKFLSKLKNVDGIIDNFQSIMSYSIKDNVNNSL